MMLLAVDTSTSQVGIALYNGAQVRGETSWQGSRHHTIELAPAIADLLRRCGLAMDAVQALAVALGPGSFTSLRVGLSLVKGLALARRLPVIGIPTLDIHAAGQPVARLPLLAAVQAGRGRLAISWYKGTRNGWRARGPASLVPVDSLMFEIRTPTIVCGEFTAEDRQKLAKDEVNVKFVSPVQSVRRPAVLAELAWNRWQNGDVDELATLAPLYLHATVQNAV